ncbi:MAG TPA: hypothetical protein VGP76_12945 [Planctomycetaceae bacterium]|jgi:hypothetical protein|nr:hypothetical protein [Planctomycetaceae bacterium]
MKLFIAYVLIGLSILAAMLSVRYKRYAALVKTSLPPPQNDQRWALVRYAHGFILALCYEAFFRAFCLHLSFAGMVIALEIEGYKATSPTDAWTNPNAPALLCLLFGVLSQFVLNEEVIEKITISIPRLLLIILFLILTGSAYYYSVYLSIRP